MVFGAVGLAEHAAIIGKAAAAISTNKREIRVIQRLRWRGDAWTVYDYALPIAARPRAWQQPHAVSNERLFFP